MKYLRKIFIDSNKAICCICLLLSLLSLSISGIILLQKAENRVGTIKYGMVTSKSIRLNKILDEENNLRKNIKDKFEGKDVKKLDSEVYKKEILKTVKYKQDYMNLIRNASYKVAKDKGINMVVSSTLIFTPSIDITDDVIKEIDNNDNL